MKELAVEIVQLTMRFDQQPLFSDLSLRIHKGEFVAVIGPNGSGKTTLMKAVMGLHKPDAGHIHVYEENIGYVPQHVNKDEFSPMTVRELLALKLPYARFWFKTEKQEETMRDVLRQTNIEHVLDKQIKHLSGGQFQRLMIAYALIGDPGLLILDEPISGIDVHGEQEFFELLEDIHQKRDMTIVLISHDIDVVYRYASQVVCLNKTLVCQGKPTDVLTQEAIEKTFSEKRGFYHHQHLVDEESQD